MHGIAATGHMPPNPVSNLMSKTPYYTFKIYKNQFTKANSKVSSFSLPTLCPLIAPWTSAFLAKGQHWPSKVCWIDDLDDSLKAWPVDLLADAALSAANVRGRPPRPVQLPGRHQRTTYFRLLALFEPRLAVQVCIV